MLQMVLTEEVLVEEENLSVLSEEKERGESQGLTGESLTWRVQENFRCG